MTIWSRNDLVTFLHESNRIEGIKRVTIEESVATEAFLALAGISVLDLCALVNVYEFGSRLRDQVGMDVVVGKGGPMEYHPPKGGPRIGEHLNDLISGGFYIPKPTPFQQHFAFEALHPFTDGNGRAGRALWLWRMVKRDGQIPPLGFLHTWYYQSLNEGR